MAFTNSPGILPAEAYPGHHVASAVSAGPRVSSRPCCREGGAQPCTRGMRWKTEPLCACSDPTKHREPGHALVTESEGTWDCDTLWNSRAHLDAANKGAGEEKVLWKL